MSSIIGALATLFTGPPGAPKIEIPEAPQPSPPPQFRPPPPAAEPRVDPSLAEAQRAMADERERARRRPRRRTSGIATSPLGRSNLTGGGLTQPTATLGG